MPRVTFSADRGLISKKKLGVNFFPWKKPYQGGGGPMGVWQKTILIHVFSLEPFPYWRKKSGIKSEKSREKVGKSRKSVRKKDWKNRLWKSRKKSRGKRRKTIGWRKKNRKKVALPYPAKNQSVHLTPYKAKIICYAGIVKKTSQELRMLSNVTLNCQETKTVMNSGSQLSW